MDVSFSHLCGKYLNHTSFTACLFASPCQSLSCHLSSVPCSVQINYLPSNPCLRSSSGGIQTNTIINIWYLRTYKYYFSEERIHSLTQILKGDLRPLSNDEEHV